MIETMKSVTIVAQASRRQEMLLSLRHAGLLHIRHLTRTCPASEEIAAKMHSLLGVMNAVVDEAGKSAKGIRQEKLDGDALDSMICDLEKTISQRKAAEDEHLRLSSEITRIEPWGDFDPDALKALAGEGYAFFFYTLDDNVLDAVRQDEDVVFVPLRDVNRMKAIAVLGARLPSAKYMDAFKLEVKRLEEASMFERVKATSQEEQNRIVFISGYLPEDRCDDFRSLAGENGWAYLIDDVADDEDPPTQLKYKGLIRIIQPIYDILGTVPGYREYDISSWFLLFFSVFFAMIIGDAGYGLIFLLIALVMNVRAKKCSDANILLYVLSATTIIYGAVTGTWFGSLAVLEKLPFLQLFIIPSICNYSMELYGIESVYAQNAVMQLCFMLGAAQLGLACVLNVISKVRVRDLSLLGDIGWLMDVCVLYMMALYLVIGASVDFTVVIVGVAVGFFLVVVFGSQEPGKSFGAGLKSGLGGFFTSFLDTVSCFSNIMSYIRLFAVGMASLAIAQSFNSMADMAGPVFGAVIVVLGTVLNIVMGLLSVIVHGVRLNLLEFSGQLGMEWTGYKYDPFRETVDKTESEQGVVK